MKEKTLAQGAVANMNGRAFELSLIPLFEENGFPVIRYSEFQKHPEEYKELSKYVLTNVPFTSVYGHRGRTEYLLVNGEEKIRIEAKCQTYCGSVDEKYAYVLDNALYAYPEKNTILLLEGNGMKDGVRKYFDRILNDGFPKGHRMYAKSKYVRMHMKEEGISFKVNSLSQFIDWFHHEMTA